MAPHVNKWSPLDGAYEKQVTVIVTTSELRIIVVDICLCNDSAT